MADESRGWGHREEGKRVRRGKEKREHPFYLLYFFNCVPQPARTVPSHVRVRFHVHVRPALKNEAQPKRHVLKPRWQERASMAAMSPHHGTTQLWVGRRHAQCGYCSCVRRSGSHVTPSEGLSFLPIPPRPLGLLLPALTPTKSHSTLWTHPVSNFHRVPPCALGRDRQCDCYTQTRIHHQHMPTACKFAHIKGTSIIPV